MMLRLPREAQRIRKVAEKGTLAEFMVAMGIPLSNSDRLMLVAFERMRRSIRRGGPIPRLAKRKSARS